MMDVSCKYAKLNLDFQEAYVRMDKLNQLKNVDAVIFDCDGVLIDISNSYNKAISKTVAFIFSGLTGYSIQESLVSDDVILQFRRTGGFNNDWDTVYGVLMFMLSYLPESLRVQLKKSVETLERQQDPAARFFLIKAMTEEKLDRLELSEEFFKELINGLKDFTKRLDIGGAESVDRNLVSTERFKELPGFYRALKDFLRYPAKVGESIVVTVFEEFYCGPGLFFKTYGIEPKFYNGPGMVENATAIVRRESLDQLTSLLGKANFGVVSGSRFEPAKYILKEILDRFNPKALVFLDEIERTEIEYSIRDGLRVNLKKPNPFSLLKALEAMNPVNLALYVGDSMEDVMMVREATKTNPHVLSAGVYGRSYAKDAYLRTFFESGCDVVLPSVNELPVVLDDVRGKKS